MDLLIKRLTIQEGAYTKHFEFSDKCTLITSNGENGTGKTTLIRCILYAMGEAVSGTQGFRFKSKQTFTLLLTIDNNECVFTRTGSTVVIKYHDESERFELPYELYTIKSKYFGLNNPLIAANSLGSTYIDQDKGWTLLNRGKVSADIRFTIENFIRGFSNRDYSPILSSIERLKGQIKKYEFATKVAEYQESVIDSQPNTIESKKNERDRTQIQQLGMRAATLKGKIARIRTAQKNNQQFIQYIESLKLRVRLEDGKAIPITSTNIDSFNDNDAYMDAEVSKLQAQLHETTKTIKQLESSLNTENQLLELPEEISFLDKQINSLHLDGNKLNNVLQGLKAEKTKMTKELQDSLINCEAYNYIAMEVCNYCKKLGVENYYLKDPKGILTSELKTKSGTNLQLLVFAFRLAYASTIYHFLDLRLPLIIDSPRGREMNKQNFKKCMELLQGDFSDWQIIIASINDVGIKYEQEITLHNSMMEDANLTSSYLT